MKNAISSVWLIGLVTLFIFLFAGYLAVTVSYANAFRVKNEVLSIIERQRGLTNKVSTCSTRSLFGGGNVCGNNGAFQIISAYLVGSGYKTRGSCEQSTGGRQWYGVTKLHAKETGHYEAAQAGKKYYYCFTKNTSYKANESRFTAYYYDIVLFYKMDLPVVGDIFTFRVNGMTADIYNVQDSFSANPY